MFKQFVFSLLFCFQACFAVDFDVIVLGTSPISLIEALYQHHTGKTVLILEGSGECGGAWKSREICGIPHADVACHEIGRNLEVLKFLENYIGCTAISMEPPNPPYCSSTPKQQCGYYFSHGCYELINNLLKLIEECEIPLLLNQRLESVLIEENQTVIAKLKEHQFSTTQLIISRHCNFSIENQQTSAKLRKQNYHHIYLLIEDDTLPCFCYRHGRGTDIVRAMNLSPFVGLVGTGRHLIIAQIRREAGIEEGQKYLDSLKQLKLVEASAKLLQVEVGSYEQYSEDASFVKEVNAASGLIQILETSTLEKMLAYISKWKEVLLPLKR